MYNYDNNPIYFPEYDEIFDWDFPPQPRAEVLWADAPGVIG